MLVLKVVGACDLCLFVFTFVRVSGGSMDMHGAAFCVSGGNKAVLRG